jgi:hypothetical protein
MGVGPGPNGGIDSGVLKFDGDGNQLWESIYGGSSTDVATSVTIAADGGIYLAGLTYSFNTWRNDMWVTKYAQDGQMLWSKTYGDTCGGGWEGAANIVNTDDGGFIVGGGGSGGAVYAKADANGDFEWSDCTPGGWMHDFRRANDGGYVGFGRQPVGSMEGAIFKYDENMDLEWSRTYGDTGFDLAIGGIPTKDGGYAFTGYFLATATAGFGADDLWFVKTDAFGNVEHELIIGSALGNDQGDMVLELSDGRYAIPGRLFESAGGLGSTDAALVFIEIIGDPATVDGTVFFDEEEVCTETSESDGRPNQWVELQEIGGDDRFLTLTNTRGDYRAIVPEGDWKVSPVPGPNAMEADSCGPDGISYDLSLEEGVTRPDTDFYTRSSQTCGGDVTLYSYAPVDNGFEGCNGDEIQTGACIDHTFGFCAQYVNTGNSPWTQGNPATFTLTVPPEFEATANGVSNIVTNSCGMQLSGFDSTANTWSFQNTTSMGNGAMCEVCVVVDTLNSPPTTGASATIVAPPTGPCKDEVWAESMPPVGSCSCDPNDLAATPEGCGPEQNILAEELTYRVRFQNEGYGDAVDVRVVLDLDTDLDPDTLRVIDTSHDLTSLQVNDRGEMVAHFDTINLPPKLLDDPGSNGHLRFAISPRLAVADGTPVDVTASIYFDANAPVVTNTVTRTLYHGDPVPVPNFEVSEQAGVFDFTYTGGTAGVSTSWDLGVGATPESATTLHVDGVTYTTPGPRFATLTTEKNGCATTSTQRVDVSCDAFFEIGDLMAPMGNAKQLGATMPVKFKTLRYLGTEVTDAAHLEQILTDEFGWTPGEGCWPRLGVVDMTTGERVPLETGDFSTDAGNAEECFTGGAGNWSVNLKLDAAAFTSGHEYQVVAEMYACYGFDAIEPGNDTFSVK